MINRKTTKVVCQICKQEKKLGEVMPAELIRNGITETIRKKFPQWPGTGYICLTDLNHFRTMHIQDVLEQEKGEVSVLEADVLQSLKEHEMLSKNINSEFEQKLTFGERLADRVASFGGSWRFIITFGVVMALWIIINTAILLSRAYDPYPFILLNLMLSCLAALQAPVIMMSQNRQEAKDRLRSEHDYRVNLKAELEIRHLNEKIDQLLKHQWQRLLEIQEMQMESMEEIVGRNRK